MEQFEKSLSAPHRSISTIPAEEEEEEKMEIKKVEPKKETTVTSPPDETLKKQLAKRNKELIEKMKIILNDDVKFKEFRKLSASFLNSQLTEKQYYDAFLATFGKGHLNELFAELVSLLPDETKKNRLQSLHQKTMQAEKDFPSLPAKAKKTKAKKPVATASPAKTDWEITVCKECGSSVALKDWDKHTKQHAREKQQAEEEVKQKKKEEEQRKLLEEQAKMIEEFERQQELASKPRLQSSDDFPQLPGQRPARYAPTIFNKKSEEDFPSLPAAPQRVLSFSQEEVEEPKKYEEPKKKQGKKGQVLMRFG